MRVSKMLRYSESRSSDCGWRKHLGPPMLAWRSIDLVRGTWKKSRAAQHITVKTLGLIAILVLFTAPDRAWVLLKHPAIDAARYGAQLNAINHAIYGGMLWVVAISAMVWLWQIGQVGLAFYRKRVAAEK